MVIDVNIHQAKAVNTVIVSIEWRSSMMVVFFSADDWILSIKNWLSIVPFDRTIDILLRQTFLKYMYLYSEKKLDDLLTVKNYKNDLLTLLTLVLHQSKRKAYIYVFMNVVKYRINKYDIRSSLYWFVVSLQEFSAV